MGGRKIANPWDASMGDHQRIIYSALAKISKGHKMVV